MEIAGIQLMQGEILQFTEMQSLFSFSRICDRSSRGRLLPPVYDCMRNVCHLVTQKFSSFSSPSSSCAIIGFAHSF